MLITAILPLADVLADTLPDRSPPSVVFTLAKQDADVMRGNLPNPGESGETSAISEEDRRFRSRALIWGGVGAVAAYGASVWWKNGFTHHFRTINEGWFGQDTYAGGADKFGHAYATYAGTRLLTNAFEWAGNDRERALGLSAATVFGALLAAETLDGFSRKYKFSKEDVIMNAVGTGLGLLFENNKGLDDLLDFRLHYWPSGDASRLHIGPISDYSGQTYLLVAKASGMPQLKNHEVLRYLELAVGYGSRGYEPNEGGPYPGHHRNLYFGISLNISEILRNTAYRGASTPSRTQRASETVLEYIQIPGTAFMAAHRL